MDALERLQLFHVFSSTWFSIGLVVLIISIVACTHRPHPAAVAPVGRDPGRPAGPVLRPDAARPGADGGRRPRTTSRDVLRRHRFVVRREDADGATYLYGDRNRWVKLATLLTHTGLVLFLVAAAVTSRLGDEQGLVVAEGESLTVQPIGTPGLLLVRNLGFEAPGLRDRPGRPTSRPTSPSSRTASRSPRRRSGSTTRSTVGGYTFHQNGFGPAPDVVIRDADGQAAVDGPIPMTDQAAGFPFAEFAVPGRDVALQLLLQRAADGTGVLLVLPFRAVGDQRRRLAERSRASSRSRSPAASPRRPTARTSPSSCAASAIHAADREEGPRAGARLGGVRGA